MTRIPLSILMTAGVAIAVWSAGCGSEGTSASLSSLLGQQSDAQAESQNNTLGAFQAVGAFPMGPGFHGGLPGPGPLGGLLLGNPLNLTDEQQDQADAISNQLHETNKQAFRSVRDQALGLLTDEQQAALDELRANVQPGSRPPFFGGSSIADELGLTDDQKSQLQAIEDALRDTIKANRDAARESFRAILTAEQLAKLDEFESKLPGPSGGFGGL